jgi:hypothetical protein
MILASNIRAKLNREEQRRKQMKLKQLVASFLMGTIAMAVPVTAHAITTVQVSTIIASAYVGGGDTKMTVTIKNVLDNNTTNTIAWTGVNAGQGWTQADQYLQIDSTLTVSGGGIQTYTYNTVLGANPRYTGLISTTTQSPAGLVDTSTTTLKLPTAWQIVDVLGSQKGVDDPNCTGGVGQPAFCQAAGVATGWAWFYHEDKGQTEDVPSQHTTAFHDADSYVTVHKAGYGIHYAQDPASFGSAVSPNYMYLEADFANALGGRTYTTSELIVELFTQ